MISKHLFFNQNPYSMRIRKILLAFARYADAALLAFAQAVLAAMTGNLNFPTPQPTLAVLGTGITDFEEALAAAATGGVTDTLIKNQKREALVALLRELAIYVTLVSGGDDSMMSSSAMPLSKDPGPIGPLGKPEKFEVKPGEKGQLKLSYKSIYGAKTSQFEYRLTTNTEWKQVSTTSSKLLLTGLESGKEYVCRVLPIGASEVRTYSDEISCFVS